MRVLAVMRDAVIADRARQRITGFPLEFQVMFAQSFKLAWRTAQTQQFDAFVIDHGIETGLEVDAFTAFFREYPHTPILGMQVHPGDVSSLAAEKICYGTIAANVEAELFVDQVRRATELNDRMANPRISQAVRGMAAVPSPPEIIIRLNTVLAEQDADMGEVARIISEDVAIPARILQLINSAFFSLNKHMTDIRVAVAYLGLDAVRNIALAIEAFEAIVGLNTRVDPFVVKEIQQHSSSVAQLARNLVHDRNMAHDAFVAGLLHEFGRLLIASYYPAEYLQIRKNAGEVSIDRLEREYFGATHAEIGAYVLRNWGLPSRLVEAVCFQDEAPRWAQDGISPLHAVYMAEHMLAERVDPLNEYWPCKGLERMDDEYLETLGVAERVMSWRTLHVGFGGPTSVVIEAS